MGAMKCVMALAATLACVCAAADPWTAAPGDERRVAELEKAFWFCDFVATTQGVQATPVAACRYATEQLKKEKFSGNFEELLKWWRLNKPAEHLKLHQLERNEAVL